MIESDTQIILSSESTEMLNKLVAYIHERRLETPALLLIESSRPLKGLIKHLCIAFQPFLCFVLGRHTLDDLLRLSDDPLAIDQLICRLQEKR